jgi:hypothetical protein
LTSPPVGIRAPGAALREQARRVPGPSAFLAEGPVRQSSSTQRVAPTTRSPAIIRTK